MSLQAQGLVRGLDMKAPLKPILMAYANYADEFGYSWAGVDTIAFDTGYGITAVKDARRALIKDGWMATKRRFGTSSIVRLNLDLMSHKQVDRGDHWKIRPELEFNGDENPRSEPVSRETAKRKTAGQRQTAARRPTAKPQVTPEQPRDGQLDSREAAEQTAARRPLSISDPSENHHHEQPADDDVAKFWEELTRTVRVDRPGRRSVADHVREALNRGWTPASLAAWAVDQVQARGTSVKRPAGFVVTQLRDIPATPPPAAAPQQSARDLIAACPRCDDNGMVTGVNFRGHQFEDRCRHEELSRS